METKKRKAAPAVNFTILSNWRTVEDVRDAKDTFMDLLFVYLFNERGQMIIMEELEWFCQIWQFLDEMEEAVK